MSNEIVYGVDASEVGAPPIPVEPLEQVSAWCMRDSAFSQNRVVGGEPLVDIGSGPTYFSSYGLLVPQTNAIQLPVTLIHPELTFMIIFARSSASGGGTNNRIITEDADLAFLMNHTDGTLSLYGQGGTAVQATLTMPLSAIDNFHFLVGVLGGNLPNIIYNKTLGTTSVDGQNDTLRTNQGSSHPLICSSPLGTNTWAGKVMWHSTVTKRCSAPEIDAVYLAIKNQIQTVFPSQAI